MVMAQKNARRRLVVGNWKMNGTATEARHRVRLLRDGTSALSGKLSCELVVAPPAVHLALVVAELHDSSIAVAAQNVSEHAAGAYTGEVSATMLAEIGCRYVLVGHSERRALFGETDAVVAAKFVAARAAGLVPVLCVGETPAERDAGVTEQVVLRQLRAVVAVAGIAALKNAVLAYEPVWAIGTGRNASPAQAQAVHVVLRQALAQEDAAMAAVVRIIYGGSVNAGNAAALFAMPDVDGGLVGGASLHALEFLEICAVAQ